MRGLLGVAGLHAVAERVVSQHAVRVFERGRLPVAVAEIQGARLDDLAQEGIPIDRSRHAGHVPGGRILVVGRQAVRVHEIRAIAAERAHRGVHPARKILHAAGVVAGQGARGIVAAVDQQRAQELVAGVLLAGPGAELGRLAIRVRFLDGDDLREVARAGDDVGGEQLLRAGDRPPLLLVLLENHAAGVGVEQQRGLGGDDRRLRGHQGSGGEDEQQCGQKICFHGRDTTALARRF